MKNSLRVFVALSTIAMSSAAYADTALTPTAQIANDITQIVAAVLVTLIGTLLTLLVKKIHDKYGITIQQSWLDNVNQQVQLGINYAEEQANKAIDSSKLSSNDKLNIASKYILDHTNDKAIVAMSTAEIQQLIESHIAWASNRAPMIQAIATDVVTPPTPVVAVGTITTK